MNRRWQKAGKAGLIGGGSGAATGAAVGALFGRIVLFSGTLTGFGLPAVVGMAAIGLVVGAVGGAASSASVNDD